jgi:hypothetical protein
LETFRQEHPELLRPERIDPEVYADSESQEAQAALAANKAYREKLFKRQRMHQKNMVSAASSMPRNALPKIG